MIANPNLSSETSKQYSLGVAWDATDWLNLSLDYYNIEIDNQVSAISSNTIIACLGGASVSCPPGLSRRAVSPPRATSQTLLDLQETVRQARRITMGPAPYGVLSMPPVEPVP